MDEEIIEQKKKELLKKIPMITGSLMARGEIIRQCFDEMYSLGQEEAKRKAIGIVTSWKNDGDDPTEADLVLENVLSALREI